METLRRAISQYVIVQENIYHHVANVKGHSDYQQQPIHHHVTNVRGQSGQQNFHKASAEVFINLSNSRSTQVLWPCIFCKGDHYNDKCDKYTTLSEHKQKLSQQKRCFICLKTGHVLKDCSSSQKRSYSYCGKRRIP